MAQKVVMQLEGDEAQALMAVQRVIQKQRELATGARTVRQETKAATDEGVSGFGRVAGSIGKLVGSLASIGAAVVVFQKLVSLSKEFAVETERNVRNTDELRRKLMIQAGTRSPELQEAVNRQIITTKVTFEKGMETATEMISQGFSVEQIKKGALQKMLEAGVATGGREGVTEGIIGYMKSQYGPQGLTAENIGKTAAAAFGLYQRTSFQAPDLGEMAGIGTTLRKRGISVEDQLAAFTLLREAKFEPGEATTGLRNIVMRLATAGSERGRTRALGTLGLKPADVDFVGETLPQILDKIAAGAEKLSKPKAAAALKELAGERMIAQFESLIEQRGRWGEMIEYQRGGAATMGYALETGTEGVAAEARRRHVREQLAEEAHTKEIGFGAYLENLRVQSKERKESAWFRKLSEWEAGISEFVGLERVPLLPEAERGEPEPAAASGGERLSSSMNKLVGSVDRLERAVTGNTDGQSKAPVTQH